MSGFSAVIMAPFGPLGIRCTEAALVSVHFLGADQPLLAPATPLARTVVGQLQGYLDDPRQGFKLPLQEQGTPFQRRVWAALRCIPLGQCRSYGELAAELGTAARAVGGACARNPLPLVVPCHRVVACDGLGGFSGDAGGRLLDAKRWLLTHESAVASEQYSLI